jgi:spermidine synthase
MNKMNSFYRLAASFLLLLLWFRLPTKIVMASDSKTPTEDTTTTSTTTPGTLEYGFAQIEWLRSQPGGFVHRGVEVRRLWDAPNAALGVYTTVDIERGTVLMVLPQDALLTSDGTGDICDTTWKVLREYKKGNASAYAPYVQYLFARPRGQLPSAWSNIAKYILQKIIGKEEYPFDVAGYSFQEDCGGSGDPHEEHAYLSVIQRSWNDKCLPVFDMCNHRNGKWRNVDSTSAHKGEPITVYAIRNIQANEQLYLSYNECTDCDGYAYTYVTPHILREFGFVEEYPQRWLFRDSISIEIDQVEDDQPDGTLHLEWISDRPSLGELNYMRGHLRRLENMKEEVHEIVPQLESRHERDTILQYYNSLTKALELAIWDEDPDLVEEEEPEQVCEIAADGDPGTCTNPESQRVFDPLEDEWEEELDHDARSCHDNNGATMMMEESEHIDASSSFYQTIEFFHNYDTADTCMLLGAILHSCFSFRPFYHEELIHYPARYLQDVRRAIFIGGGDSMIHPELLKYPNIELIVGLELDQQVVRSCFKNYGTRPDFDNDKIQWWFGDGAKSLFMLPKEYYGSFDLVLVDLTNDVTDFLKVTENITIMDAALLLLAPGGIIMRNEDVDSGERSGQTYTDYTVNLYHSGLPILCDQSLIMGSNSVDFLSKLPIDHQIETLFEPAGNVSDLFGLWFDFRKNVDKVQICKGAGSEDQSIPDPTQMVHGILMIIEAENAEISLESSSSIHFSIREALKRAGLAEISDQMSSTVLEEIGKVHTLVFILREGYVIARAWPEHKYCAFDLMLWTGFDKHDVAKKELLVAIGSKSETSSSYRIVTGGMFGLDSLQDDLQRIGPRVTQPCHQHSDDVQTVSTELNIEGTILQESIALVQSTNAFLVVVCGENLQSCKSIESISKTEGIRKIVPVFACPNILQTENIPSRDMVACEGQILKQLQYFVADAGMIDGIIIDPDAPRPIGQIFHRILRRKSTRRNLLRERFVVIETSTASTKSSWRRILLNRLQKEIVVFDPAYRADISFMKNRLELGVFSAGDANFYSHLVEVISSIEAKTGIAADVHEVTNGRMNYVADYLPDYVFSYKDFDMNATVEQWNAQYPIGMQTIFQFEQQTTDVEAPPLSPLRLKGVIESALDAMELEEDEEVNFLIKESIGEGCAVTAIWNGGNAILVWDGRGHVDVNIFTHSQSQPIHSQFSSHFAETFSRFSLVARDEQPRGFGRVVLFSKDMEEEPYWFENGEDDE